jgi:hypothetical protein
VPKSRRKTSQSERLHELRSAHACDATLQNLIAVLATRLDLCAKLAIYEYEADNEGFADSASFFSAVASAERESVRELVQSLRHHLDQSSAAVPPPAGRLDQPSDSFPPQVKP